jgi:hypothetical protein
LEKFGIDEEPCKKKVKLSLGERFGNLGFVDDKGIDCTKH